MIDTEESAIAELKRQILHHVHERKLEHGSAIAVPCASLLLVLPAYGPNLYVLSLHVTLLYFHFSLNDQKKN